MRWQISMLGLACMLELGCHCGPQGPSGGLDGTGSSGTATEPGSEVGSASATTNETEGGPTESGSTGADEVPPWDGNDPSCGDGVPEPGVYCFEKTIVPGVRDVLGVADFDGDDHIDLLSRDGSTFVVWFGDGTGAFPTSAQYPVPPPWDRAVVGETSIAQMDDDPAPDIVVLRAVDDSTGRVTVFRNDGTGTSFDQVSESLVVGNMQSFEKGALLPIDEDDASDFVGISSTLAVGSPVLQPAINDGLGSLVTSGTPLSFEELGACGVMDASPIPAVGGARPGLAVIPSACTDTPLVGAAVTLVRPDGAADVTYAAGPATGRNPLATVAADFDGDMRGDLAVWSSGWTIPPPDEDATLAVFLGDASGQFGSARSLAASDVCVGCPCPACGWVDPPPMRSGDLDGDGRPDLTVGSWVVTRVGQEPKGVWLDVSPKLIADLDEDGVDDVVTFYDGQTTLILLSNP